MKIALINNLYKPYARGGAERIAETIVNELVKQKHEVAVIASKPFFGKKIVFNTKYSMLNIYFWNIISYYNLNKLPKLIRPLWHLMNIFNLHSYFKIKKILKTEKPRHEGRSKPDLVMTHNLMGVGFLTPLAIKRAGAKHIHTLHDIQLLHPSGLMNVDEEKKIDSFFAKIYQAVNKKLFNKVDVIISPSRWLLEMHQQRKFFQDSKCVVLRNPVEEIACSASSVLAEQENKPFVFLYVGQVERHKGISFLIEAFKEINNNKCELWIVGEVNRKIFNIEYLILNNRIKFLGKKNYNDVRTLMYAASCLVVPSLCYENQPTVIIEAMRNNLPAIASNIGGIPELLEEKFLFKAGDRDSLVNKMKWMIDVKGESQKLAEDLRFKVKGLNVEKYIDKILSL
jgi:glycosyltransferase involved in cell wall biosynthesis